MVRTKDFAKVIEENIEQAIDEIVSGKEKNQILNELAIIKNKIFEGLNACLLALQDEGDHVAEEIKTCFGKIKRPEDLLEYGQQVLQNTSWKEQLGISSSMVQKLYHGAKVLFDNKDYTQAANAFYAICSIDPTQYAYWIGLGHSSFNEKNYEQAIDAYGMASCLHSENAWPHIWAANCFEEMRDYAHAKMALHDALQAAKHAHPKNQEVIFSIEERIQKLNKK